MNPRHASKSQPLKYVVMKSFESMFFLILNHIKIRSAPLRIQNQFRILHPWTRTFDTDKDSLTEILTISLKKRVFCFLPLRKSISNLYKHIKSSGRGFPKRNTIMNGISYKKIRNGNWKIFKNHPVFWGRKYEPNNWADQLHLTPFFIEPSIFENIHLKSNFSKRDIYLCLKNAFS